MKKVEAIIRPDRLDSVVEGLSGIGYPGLTITEVKGHGKQGGVKHQWRGNEYIVRFVPKVKIEVVVLDEDLYKTIDIIVRNSRTGSIGDGKIFITEVEEAIRVRTGDAGTKAI
ncbi:MAG: P-II family nitrogen regulator [Actinobacteria bacterium]|nr:P-II family nitrogen regulator [Actinomycetota bacterium]